MNDDKLKKISKIAFFLIFIILLIIIIYSLKSILILLLVPFILAYALDPVVDFFEARKIPRTGAIFLLLTFVSIIIALLFLSVGPTVQREIGDLQDALPRYSETLQEKVIPGIEKTFKVQFPSTFQEGLEEIINGFRGLPSASIKPFTSVVARVFSNTISFILSLLGLVIIPLLTFYFLRDIDQIKKVITSYFPLKHRDKLIEKFNEIDLVLSGFIRGQLTICAIMAVLYSIGLLLVGIDLALVIGILSGLAAIVPYLGTILGIVLASIMCVLKFGFDIHLLGVFTCFAVVQTLEGSVIGPRIVGKKVGLHPVWVIIAVLIGGDFFGFLGILLAVPVAAVLNVVLKSALETYRKSSLYLGQE
ncbi:MAG: AI-2E family transporter [Deltaproteobacteria bacterium]|nr:MAG: AI-2E family transporter [Deltaproteobacteria bacterium]